MKIFTDSRRFFWLGGVAVLIVGFIVAALVLPTTSDPMKGMGPAVSVPKIKNIPPDGARVTLDVDKSEQAAPEPRRDRDEK